jgi:hypothetical protein
MKYQKQLLVQIAKKVQYSEPLHAEELQYLLDFQKEEKENNLVAFIKQAAIPVSLVIGFLLAAFSHRVEEYLPNLPSWTNLPAEIAGGLDYFWGLFGEPIEKENIIFHLPNLILYSFGIAGLKTLFEKLEHRSWLDKVLTAQERVQQDVKNGELKLQMRDGHSVLFVGGGDFIGMQFAMYQEDGETLTIADSQPTYTRIWNKYDMNSPYDDLKQVLKRASGANAGEYFFFPVKDDQIFLPAADAYDLSPQKIDILCQNIRLVESEQGWSQSPIMIVGDRFHHSVVRSEDHKKVIPESHDFISLESIAEKYQNVFIFDPTDIVLQEVIRIARGRQIVFRATDQGIKEYKERFYERLIMLGYNPQPSLGVLTIGYDLFEEQTEQQTLARKVDDYYPVVLSKYVRDALLRNGYTPNQFLYVPDLVMEEIAKAAAMQ